MDKGRERKKKSFVEEWQESNATPINLPKKIEWRIDSRVSFRTGLLFSFYFYKKKMLCVYN